MDNYKIKIRLYMESLVPLFLIIGLHNLKRATLSYFINEPFIGAAYHFVRNNRLSTGLLTLAAVAFLSLLIGFRPQFRRMKKTQKNADIKINGLVCAHAYSYWLFFVTYIIPCGVIYAFGFKGKALTLLLLAFLGIFSIYTPIYYKNPVLWFLGYRIYADNSNEGNSVFIAEGLSKGDISKDSEYQQVYVGEGQYLIVNPERFWRVKYLCNRLCKLGGWLHHVCGIFVQAFIHGFFCGRRLLAWIVRKHPALAALLYSSVIMTAMWVSGFMRWEGADDFTMSQLLMGSSGERTPYVLTSSYFLGEFIVWLQETVPIMNWFTGLEILSIWVSFAIMEWFILKHSGKSGFTMAFLFPVIFEPLYFLNLQYTRSAFLLPFAGLLLIYDATIRDIFPKMEQEPDAMVQTLPEMGVGGGIFWNTLKAVLGILIFISGTLFRFACFYAGVAYVGILVFAYVVSTVKEKCFKNKASRAIRFSVVTSVAAVLSFFIYGMNTEVYNQWSKTNDYRTYNKMRSDITDYIPVEYSEEFSTDDFEISYNDWYMMKCAVINDQVFSYDYYEKVLENLNGVRDDTGDNTGDDERNDARDDGGNNFEYNLRQAFYYRSGRATGRRTQFVICVLLFFTALLIGRRKQQLGILPDIMGTAVLIGYFLMGNRLPPWVADPIYLLASYIAIIYICCSGYDLSEKKIYGYAVKEYVTGTIFLLCLCINMVNSRELINRDYYNGDLMQAIQYAEETDGVFLLDNISRAPYPYIDVYGATYCFSKGQWDNIIRVGNWDVGHPERERQKEALGIESVIYSMLEGKSMLISRTGSSSFDVYKDFFREHYDTEVVFTQRKSFGEYGIYSCRVRTSGTYGRPKAVMSIR